MMMIYFALYDSKALCFLQPFPANSVGAAVRGFDDLVNGEKGPVSMHPGDYQLYEIGTFNDQDGLLKPLTPAKLHGNGLDFVKRPVVSDAVRRAIENPLATASEISNGGDR